MSNLYESLKALNLEGKKITLISYGEFGFLGATQTTVKELNAKKHYQYAPDDMTDIEILHTPKRKRTSYSKRISYNSSLLIYDGWIDIDIESFMYNQIDEYTRESKYTCFDKRYLQDIKTYYNNKNIKPLFERI